MGGKHIGVTPNNGMQRTPIILNALRWRCRGAADTERYALRSGPVALTTVALRSRSQMLASRIDE
jgi:hypothetical protein